ELAAGLRDEGYFTADRDGVITLVSLHGRILIGCDESEVVGRPLSALVARHAQADLRAMLERPARFAETARPGAVLAGALPGLEITIFAEGQAGIVAGYFGFIGRRAQPESKPTPAQAAIDGETLARISRGLRRPLNTIIGFADLMRSAEAEPMSEPPYVEYAGDIATAGLDIAELVDEIEELARLNGGGRHAPGSALDLIALLDTCAMQVRPQAAARRVLVRSAVSNQLPRVRADHDSLAQAILNLLTSAIDQSPAGGSVILSATCDDVGGITINVRDSASGRREAGEDFAVVRHGAAANGRSLVAFRSSIGLALTRSLLAVNALSLTVDPVIGVGTLYSMSVPADLVIEEAGD
ncbi:MAG TPA: histidine kinase dimerization/phospho-acceptor domain-containing protein, partial [Alphaproteobacteria bacterium]|nr:histidine kinase dimerization/phospho-acceptor domain-containing protein [Alphaproteobacteria bacterium]